MVQEKNNRIKFYFLWLSGICIIMFILQNLILGFTESLLLNKSALSGEIWRFLSAIFLHSSLEHLIFNLAALLLFGFTAEKLVGSKIFLLVFLGTGIIANIVSVNFYSSSLGASGAIMGIIGLIVAIRPGMMVWAFGLILPMWIAAIVWIIGDTLGLFMPTNVGNIAHLSGIFVGLLIGISLRIKNKKKNPRENNNKVKIEIPDYYVKDWEEKYMKR
jgi:membrane associated rhomboid family serine protease